MIRDHTIMSDSRSLQVLSQLTPTDVVIDVGAGIRPCPVFKTSKHIVIEPHDQYLAVLKEHSHRLKHTGEWEFHQGTAIELLPKMPRSATVLLLDVIEHMDRETGEQVRDLAEEFVQALLFTPDGFKTQKGEGKDPWGYDGWEWQTHRSGWRTEDFKNWKVAKWARGLLCYRLLCPTGTGRNC